MKNTIRLVITFSLLLFSQLAFAAVVENPDDYSVNVLRQIFGDIVNVISGGQLPGEEPDALTGALVRVINESMLGLSVILVLFALFSAIFEGASKGQLDPQKYDSFMFPMRLLVSLTVVIPVAAGYSLMQIGVFYVGGHGINTANKVHEAGLDFIEQKGTVLKSTSSFNHRGLVYDMLTNTVCVLSVKNALSTLSTTNTSINMDEVGIHILEQEISAGSSQNKEIVEAKIEYSETIVDESWFSLFDEESVYKCGIVTINGSKFNTSESAINKLAFEYQTSIISYITEDLTEAVFDLAYELVYFDQTGSADELPEEQALEEIIANFRAIQREAEDNMLSKLAEIYGNKPNDVGLESFDAYSCGWACLGGLWWEHSRRTSETNSILNSFNYTNQSNLSKPVIELAMKGDLTNPERTFLYFMNQHRLVEDRNTWIKITSSNARRVPARFSGNTHDDENIPEIEDTSAFSLPSVSDIAIGWILDESDPMTSIAETGHQLILTWEALSAINFIATATQKTLDYNASAVPDVVKPFVSIPYGWGSALLETIMASTLGLMTAVLPLALIMAFYIPALPIIHWVLALTSYFVMFIEAVFVAPIHALGHALLGGSGIVPEQVKQGYMILLGLYFRPSFLVIGYYAAMQLIILSNATLKLTFGRFVTGMMEDVTLVGIVTAISMCAVLVVATISIINRCMAFITEVADRCLRSIGGGQENLGEATHIGGTQGNFTMIGGGVVALGQPGETQRKHTIRDRHNNRTNKDNNRTKNNDH